jgi:TPR repeat protein
LAALLSVAPITLAVEDGGDLEALRRQALGGSVAAQYEMGVLYEYGFHMKDNLPHALAWYMTAADSGDERAVQRRDLLQGRMNAADVEQARRLKGELDIRKPAAEAPAPAASEAVPSDKPANP